MSESKNLIQPEIDYKDAYEKLQVKYRILEKEYILFMEFMKRKATRYSYHSFLITKLSSALRN